jgi:acyl-CoA synthetase (AMP-forming)/AMP-acid ligase II
MTIDNFLDINAHKYPNREDVLFQHAKIVVAAAFGQLDEPRGEKVCTALVGRPGEYLKTAEIIDFCTVTWAGFTFLVGGYDVKP